MAAREAFQSSTGPQTRPPPPELSQNMEELDPSRTGTHERFPFQKAPKYQNQLILGVMAVDVSLEDIKRLTPRFTVQAHMRHRRSRFTRHVMFTHSRRSAPVWTQRLLFRHRPQWIRTAAPKPPAAGKGRTAGWGTAWLSFRLANCPT